MGRRWSLSLLILVASVVFYGLPSVFASGCGTTPTGITACIPVNIINTQSSATTNGFTMEFNGLTANMLQGNYLIYNSLSGWVPPQWVENSTITWANLGANTICSSCTVNGVYVIGIAASGVNLFLKGNNLGEAPQYSSTYGQYDNGNQVFVSYYDFYGTSLPGTWTVGSGGTATVSNGLTYVGGGAWTAVHASNAITIANQVIDGYIKALDSGTTGGIGVSSSGGNVGAGSAALEEQIGGSWFLSTGINNGATSAFGSPAINVFYVATLRINSSTTISGAINYGFNAIGVWTGATSVTNTLLAIADFGSAREYAQWIRIRVMAPNNKMPTVNYQQQQITAQINLPASITYGNTFTITSTCNAGDSCQVYQVTPSVQECTGTTTCSYTTPILGAGSYSYNAVDSTYGYTSGSQTLTVTQATPTVTLPSFPANAAYTGAPLSITANVQTINNQLTANDWVNSALVTSFTTQNVFTENNLGTYTVVANTLGNANYIAATTSSTFTIYVPFYAYNTIDIANVIFTNSPFTWNSYYPIYLTVNSPSNSFNYSLSQQIGATVTQLATNSLTLGYVPLSTQATGNYIYTLLERQQGDGGLTVSLVLSANVLSMASVATLTYTGVCVYPTQYLSNCANATFNAAPLSWMYRSDNPLNNHANQLLGATWSNANLTVTPNIILTYSAPFGTFQANVLDNPAITAETQNAWAVLAEPSAPANYISRNVVGITNYNQTSFNSISALDSVSFGWTFNNYTGTVTNLQYTANNFAVYIPHSSFVNPILSIMNTTISSSATNYEPTQNNYLTQTQTYNNPLIWNIYMAPVSTSAGIVFDVYQCNNFVNNDYLKILSAGNTGGGLVPVQYLKLTGTAPTDYLVATQLYQYIILSATNSVLSTSGLSAPSTPTTINLPCNVTIPNPPVPAITVKCTSTYTANAVTCKGADNDNVVSVWKVKVYTTPTIVSQNVIISNTIAGNPFTFTYSMPNHTSEFFASISAVVPTYPGNYMLNAYTYSFFGSASGNGFSPGLSYNVLLAMVLLLGWFGVVWISPVAFLFGTPFLVILMQYIGIVALSTNFVVGIAIVFILAGLIVMYYRD